MKVAPVSADLLVKLALGVLLVGGAVWAIRKAATVAGDAAGQVLDAAATAIDTVNPVNPNNVFARGANAAASAATGRDETVGGWFYDLTHRDPVNSWTPPITGGEVQPGAADPWANGAYAVPGAFM